MSVRLGFVPRRPGGRRLWRDLGWLMAFGAALAVAVQAAMPLYVIDGTSMSPTLIDGDRLRITYTATAPLDPTGWWRLLAGEQAAAAAATFPLDRPRRGDILVFTPPIPAERPFVKRVIGLSGDTIAFAEGRVLLNGEQLVEPYLAGAQTYCRGLAYCEAVVPADSVYVLGDNRTGSVDSRSFGPVALAAVIGEAWPDNAREQ